MQKFIITKENEHGVQQSVNDENDVPYQFDTKEEAYDRLEELGGDQVQYANLPEPENDELVEADGGV